MWLCRCVRPRRCATAPLRNGFFCRRLRTDVPLPHARVADPSGTFTRYDAKAIGAGSEGAQTALQEQFHKKLTIEEAEKMAVSILKQARCSRDAAGV